MHAATVLSAAVFTAAHAVLSPRAVTAAQASASAVTDEVAVSVQVAADTKMFVTEPAAQVAQAVDGSESSSYLPAAHAVHVVLSAAATAAA